LKDLYTKGKKSLETILREKAYDDVKGVLQEKGISIDDVSDEDVEALVSAKTDDMMSTIKGFGIGTAFTLALSLLTGI